MSIGTNDPSVGGASSIGTAPAHNDDPEVTHARGRIDDVVRHLTSIREKISPEVVGQVAATIDDLDALVETALDDLLSEPDETA